MWALIACETEARNGMVVNEDIILEIVRPGTGDPVSDGEVGEIVVTTLDPHHPMIRLALGDLTAALPGLSPCGRTNRRIRGWMGRADQTAKVKGMFVRPEQIAEIAARRPSLRRLRLVVTRQNENDAMALRVSGATPEAGHRRMRSAACLQAITKLRGAVEVVAPGTLPNDGKVIADEHVRLVSSGAKLAISVAPVWRRSRSGPGRRSTPHGPPTLARPYPRQPSFCYLIYA